MVKLGRSKKEGASARRGGGEGAVRAGGRGRFILIIGDEGAIMVFMQGRKVIRRLFAPSPQPDHTAGMVELMQANPRVPVLILADVIDQQYVRHSFPPVSALSVAGIVKRRMDRDFQAEDLKGFISLGREKGGRREWNYLLIALANTPLMQQWLDLVVELPNELKGIYLSPVEGQSYIPALKKGLGGLPLPWQLLVSHNKVSGFRQIVLKDGKLVFTRVTQSIDDALAAVIAGNIEQEILNTLEYLRRMGFQDSRSLEIIVVAAQEVKEVLDLARFNAGATHSLSPFDVSESLHLEQAALSADRFGDVVMAASFGAAKKPMLKLLTAYSRQLSQFYQLRRAILATAAVLVLGMGYLIAGNLLSAMGDSGAADTTEEQRRPLQGQLGQVRKSIAGLDKDVAFKAAVVAAHNMYVRDALSPIAFVNQLAPLMPADVRVAAVSWKERQAAAAAANPVGVAQPPTDGAGPLEIKVSLEFTGTYRDVESLSASATAFIGMLGQKMPLYSISHGNFPWAANSQQSLEISFDQAQAPNPVQEGQNKVDVVFVGPRSAQPANSPQPGMSGAPGAMP